MEGLSLGNYTYFLVGSYFSKVLRQKLNASEWKMLN